MNGSNNVAKDVDGDREHWVPVTFTEVPLDPSNEPLDLWAFAHIKGKVIVNVEGVDVTEVLFDCKVGSIWIQHLLHKPNTPLLKFPTTFATFIY